MFRQQDMALADALDFLQSAADHRLLDRGHPGGRQGLLREARSRLDPPVTPSPSCAAAPRTAARGGGRGRSSCWARCSATTCGWSASRPPRRAGLGGGPARARPVLEAAAAARRAEPARCRCARAVLDRDRDAARPRGPRSRGRVVWLDAHGDFNTPATSGSGYLGGMPLAAACGLWDSGYGAGVDPRAVVLSDAPRPRPGGARGARRAGVRPSLPGGRRRSARRARLPPPRRRHPRPGGDGGRGPGARRPAPDELADVLASCRRGRPGGRRDHVGRARAGDPAGRAAQPIPANSASGSSALTTYWPASTISEMLAGRRRGWQQVGVLRREPVGRPSGRPSRASRPARRRRGRRRRPSCRTTRRITRGVSGRRAELRRGQRAAALEPEAQAPYIGASRPVTQTSPSPWHAVRVAAAEQRALDLHRQVQRRAADELAGVHVAAEGPGRHHGLRARARGADAHRAEERLERDRDVLAQMGDVADREVEDRAGRRRGSPRAAARARAGSPSSPSPRCAGRGSRRRACRRAPRPRRRSARRADRRDPSRGPSIALASDSGVIWLSLTSRVCTTTVSPEAIVRTGSLPASHV